MNYELGSSILISRPLPSVVTGAEGIPNRTSIHVPITSTLVGSGEFANALFDTNAAVQKRKMFIDFIVGELKGFWENIEYLMCF
jgi:hypothetical protein